MYKRWTGPDRRAIEHNAARARTALYEELLEFAPGRMQTAEEVFRVKDRYFIEAAYLFEKPFLSEALESIDMTNGERERTKMIEEMKRDGVLVPGDHTNAQTMGSYYLAMGIDQLAFVYHWAEEHRWHKKGRIGPAPTPIVIDVDQWDQTHRESWGWDQQSLDENAAGWLRIAARAKARRLAAIMARAPDAVPSEPQWTPPPPLPKVEKPKRVDRYHDLRAGEFVDMTIPVTMSPRDHMRPILEAAGRLDLLHLYSNRLVQYGPLETK